MTPKEAIDDKKTNVPHPYAKKIHADLSEDKEKICIEIYGVEKADDVKVLFTVDGIKINAKTNKNKQRISKNSILAESESKEFAFFFTLPQSAETKKAKTELKNGLLQIIIPKIDLVTVSKNSNIIKKATENNNAAQLITPAKPKSKDKKTTQDEELIEKEFIETKKKHFGAIQKLKHKKNKKTKAVK